MAPSLELLQKLDARHAFDPVALPGYRTLLYVPFERLLGGRHESRLRSELENGQRVALVGPIGSGKSSLVEFAMEEGSERFAPIWISAAHEGQQTLTDPPEFARHLIRQIVGWARDAQQLGEEESRSILLETTRTLPRRTASRRQTVSLKLALNWLEPGWSREVEQTLADPEIARNRGDFVASLGRLVDLIHEDLGRTPVVIIDDSDRWLSLGEARRDELIEKFFTDTARTLAEINWSIVMAIHPEYCATPAFRSALANGLFNVQLDVPRLARPESLRELLDARIQTVAAGVAEEEQLEAGRETDELPLAASVDDVFESGFESVLLDYYEANDLNLRAVLTVAHQALQETINLGEALVTTSALREVGLALAQ
jgi:hypothetical protein